MSKTILPFDLEDTSMHLSSAIKAFQIILEDMECDLLAQERAGCSLGPGHGLECCDAMHTVLQALCRIDEDLDAIVAAAYEKKKEGSICQD